MPIESPITTSDPYVRARFDDATALWHIEQRRIIRTSPGDSPIFQGVPGPWETIQTFDDIVAVLEYFDLYQIDTHIALRA